MTKLKEKIIEWRNREDYFVFFPLADHEEMRESYLEKHPQMENELYLKAGEDPYDNLKKDGAQRINYNNYNHNSFTHEIINEKASTIRKRVTRKRTSFGGHENSIFGQKDSMTTYGMFSLDEHTNKDETIMNLEMNINNAANTDRDKSKKKLNKSKSKKKKIADKSAITKKENKREAERNKTLWKDQKKGKQRSAKNEMNKKVEDSLTTVQASTNSLADNFSAKEANDFMMKG